MSPTPARRLRVYVDGRWFAQPGQGVVTFLRDLHVGAETILAQRRHAAGEQGAGEVGPDFEFVYGVESLEDIPRDMEAWHASFVEVGRRGLLWRWLWYPIWLRHQRIDLAHFQYVCPLWSRGTRYVTAIHDILFLSQRRFFALGHTVPRAFFYGVSAHRSARVLTISDASAQDIRRYFRRDALDVVPLAVARQALAAPLDGPLAPLPAGVKARQFLLAVGRIEPRKNYDHLLDAFVRSGLADQGVQLVVTGFCPAEGQRTAERFGSTPGVIWCERVSDEVLASLYHQAVGFVFPSYGEGFGLPVLEALAADLPVALSTGYPMEDVKAVAASLFDPDDVPAMAQAMQGLWALQRGPVKPAQVKVVLDRYTWDRAAKRYLDVLAAMARAQA